MKIRTAPYFSVDGGKWRNAYILAAIAFAKLFRKNHVRVKRNGEWHYVWRREKK